MDAWTASVIVGGVVGTAVFGAIFAVAVYNHLVKLKNQCANSFAQIEVQLKRRHDLIPNLVECVKQAMSHERETLERVIAARSQAISGLQQAIRRPDDPEALRAWMGAEGALAGALGRLSMTIESYPDLKANVSVGALIEQLTTTENRIAYARQSYNDWVEGFNGYRQAFPTCLLAGLLGFNRDRDFLEFADRDQIAEAPRVALA
jgi:LemA protein